MTTGPLRLIRSANEEEASEPQERNLILAAQDGDAAAFKVLYERYRDRVFSLISYTLKDPPLAEDVLQTVFVKVFQALPYFRHESGFHTWIYRVALNECKNRRRRRRLFVPIDQLAGSLPEVDPGTAPDAMHSSRQVSRMVQEAVLGLRPKLRSVIVLRYVEELSYEEIASVLGCSPGTVASRLHRALSILETRLSALRGSL
ncbi:MAG TPA: sigma-70 family RNA polymerase sigma factor [Acidobacteriota bacterium]|nr:sigma-70 family RNA polymerase sigma factor [Acidobacteriota bacterium]